MIRFKVLGKARAVFGYLKILGTTEPIETDIDWWELRLWLVRN